jgi:hypothetical protein
MLLVSLFSLANSSLNMILYNSCAVCPPKVFPLGKLMILTSQLLSSSMAPLRNIAWDTVAPMVVTAGYFYDIFAYEICFYGIYLYGIYIFGIHFYRALKFVIINCTVVKNMKMQVYIKERIEM